MLGYSPSGVHILKSPVGTGKTAMVLLTAIELLALDRLPPYVILAGPRTALKTVADECKRFGFRVDTLQATIVERKVEGTRSVRTPRKHRITIVEHDHLRRVVDTIQRLGSYMIVVDEVHKCFNATKRTSAAFTLVQAARFAIAMTGTMVIDGDLQKLVQWLGLVVPFPVTTRNVPAAVAMIHSFAARPPVTIGRSEIVVEMEGENLKQYQGMVSRPLGGVLERVDRMSLANAMALSQRVTDERMVQETVKHIADGVLLVAQNKQHQRRLAEHLLAAGIPPRQILAMDPTNGVNFTSLTETGLRVVIARVKYPEGFTLTAFGTMITSVYPSNQAARTQMEGRLARLSQSRARVQFIKIMSGIQVFIHKNHQSAKSIEIALDALAKAVDLQL